MVQMESQNIAATTITKSCGPMARFGGVFVEAGAGSTLSGITITCVNGNVTGIVGIAFGTTFPRSPKMLNATNQISVMMDDGGTYITGFRFAGANNQLVGASNSTNILTLSCGSSSNLINGLTLTVSDSANFSILLPDSFAIFCQSGDSYSNETRLSPWSPSSTASFTLSSSQANEDRSQTTLGVVPSQIPIVLVRNSAILISAIVGGIVGIGMLLGGLAVWTTRRQRRKRSEIIRNFDLNTLPSDVKSYIAHMTGILRQSQLYQQTQVTQARITDSAIENLTFDEADPNHL